MAPLPLLDLGPDPRERGLAHGRAMAAAIRANLETYYSRFEAGGASRATVRAQGERWGAFIAADNGEYGDEMAAIADGADVALTDIAVLNARYEITYCLFSSEARSANTGPEPPEQEGCTSFGAMPEMTATGRTMIGQNWDWLENVRGNVLVTRVRRSSRPGEGKPDFVGFTEAGIAGCKMGVNGAGIGLCVNGLVTARDGANGLRKPFHVRCREILDAWTFDKAIQPVVQTDRTCSANFLIGHGDGEIINIEATPDHCAYLYPVEGLVTHANHLVKETRVQSQFERLAPHSLYRGVRLERLLRRHAGSIDLATVAQALSDHFSAPGAICRHPDPSLPAAKRVISVTAVAIDLAQRVLHATDGQMCQTEFQSFPLSASAAASHAA